MGLIVLNFLNYLIWLPYPHAPSLLLTEILKNRDSSWLHTILILQLNFFFPSQGVYIDMWGCFWGIHARSRLKEKRQDQHGGLHLLLSLVFSVLHASNISMPLPHLQVDSCADSSFPELSGRKVSQIAVKFGVLKIKISRCFNRKGSAQQKPKYAQHQSCWKQLPKEHGRRDRKREGNVIFFC